MASTGSIRSLRKTVFSKAWKLDDEITTIARTTPTHAFLANPAGQYSYVYLTQFVKACAESQCGRGFNELSVLDWGCGKGHVTKLMRDMGAGSLSSCDIVSDSDDSAFGQATPILEHFGYKVDPLEHPFVLPYADSRFDVVLSVGVLEHVPNDRASLTEIRRVLKPGGLFFCFFLPTTLSWTQKIAHMRGNQYHDRLYSRPQVEEMLITARLQLLDIWYRQLFPKNTVHYPRFRLFEQIDQSLTEHTPLKVFATNLEFVCRKPVA